MPSSGVTTCIVENYGASNGCPGCRAIIQGTSKQTHNVYCRKRLLELSQELGNLEGIFSTNDALEGLSALIEGRKPTYQNS